MQRSLDSSIVLRSLLVIALCVPLLAQMKQGPQVAKVVPLNVHGSEYQPVLSGPPETVTMHSGLVVLAPDHSVGKHSTGRHEEVLIVLEGKGEMILGDGHTLPVEANHAVYCPPGTTHDVRNTGRKPLRYVYVVAQAE